MTTKTTAPRPITVPIASIDVDPDFNPRGRVDEKSPEFKELAASIAEQGVLQPVLLGAKAKAKGGGWPLIAGHRRLAAARKAGLKAIPALEAPSLNGGALAASIAENVVREDLSPLAEARAIARLQDEQDLRQVDAAKLLGKSERWVRERLRLLKLPDATAEAISAGSVPLQATVTLQKIADVSPETSDALAAAVAAGDLDRRTAADSKLLAHELAYPFHRGWGDRLVCIDSSRGGHLDELPVSDGVRKELAPRYEKLPPEYSWSSTQPRIKFDGRDATAARKAGALLELEHVHRGKLRWIAAGEFLDQLVAKKVARLEQAAKDRAAQQAKDNAGAPSDAEEKRLRKEEQEAERAHQAEALEANLQLGAGLQRELAAPELTLDAAKLLCLVLLEEIRPEGLAMRGIRYVDERFHQVSENRNGRKVEYSGATAAGERLVADVAAARTPQEAIGPVLQALVAAHLADDHAVAESKRGWFVMPGEYRTDVRSEIPSLIEQVALDAGVVPEAMADDIRDPRRLARGQT